MKKLLGKQAMSYVTVHMQEANSTLIAVLRVAWSTGRAETLLTPPAALLLVRCADGFAKRRRKAR